MATTIRSLTGMGCLSSCSGIAGIPCQFSTRRIRRIGGVCTVRAAGEEGKTAATATEGDGGGAGEDDFEARLAKLQRKVTSGTGKKAELRKARKEAGGDPYVATSAAKKEPDMFIPPVPMKEPISDGLPVDLGMTPYTERLHGRLAALGLAAVLLVELATGDSLIKFHDTGTLTVQVTDASTKSRQGPLSDEAVLPSNVLDIAKGIMRGNFFSRLRRG